MVYDSSVVTLNTLLAFVTQRAQLAVHSVESSNRRLCRLR
jgi:hypothetical protein